MQISFLVDAISRAWQKEVSSLAHALPLFKVLFDTLLLNTILDLTYIRIVTVHSIDSLH